MQSVPFYDLPPKVSDMLNYTKYNIECHQFLLSCSILIASFRVVSPTLNINPTSFVIPCNFFGGLHIYSVVVTITYQVI